MRDVVKVHKGVKRSDGSKVPDFVVKTIGIINAGAVKTQEEMNVIYTMEAKALESALWSHLPGGTYDRLAGFMLSRKASSSVSTGEGGGFMESIGPMLGALMGAPAPAPVKAKPKAKKTGGASGPVKKAPPKPKTKVIEFPPEKTNRSKATKPNAAQAPKNVSTGENPKPKTRRPKAPPAQG